MSSRPDSFLRFATDRLTHGVGPVSLEELYDLWTLENPSAQERAETLGALETSFGPLKITDIRIPEQLIAELRTQFPVDGE